MTNPANSKRYAAIDIGTVTCRLLIADVVKGEGGINLHQVRKERAVCNLGQDVDATGRLREDAIRRVINSLADFKCAIKDCDTLDTPVQGIRIVATSAARDAENGTDFIKAVEDLGFKLDIIPGSKEAALTFLGVTSAHPDKDLAVVDVGGGSTEISIGDANREPAATHSFDIGCRRMTERFFHHDPPTADEIEASKLCIREHFESWVQKDCKGKLPKKIYAVAGSATSAISMHEKMQVYDPKRVDGSYMSLDDLDDLFDELSTMDNSQREEVIGLDPRRAPVIVSGLMILSEAIRALGAEGFFASESDILQGEIISLALRESSNG